MSWVELDYQVQKDLVEWFNVRADDVDSQDRKRLARLYESGNFHAWDCPSCGERVYCGTPDDWSHFQGVLQVDYASFPGPEHVTPEHRVQLCDLCRMQGGVYDGPGNHVGIGAAPWELP